MEWQERGKRTLKRWLEIALQPVGRTMYVWGGGWNEADTGAGIEAVSIGVSPRWEAFFRKQDAGYDVAATRYRIHDGLDCSGFVGWAVYNLMERRSGHTGYVMPAARMALDFARRGWGLFTDAEDVRERVPGDLMSTEGHVYISLGDCPDGSTVLVHASPPGVQISGTASPDGGRNSQAVRLADYYMCTCFPAWYAKFPDSARGPAYLTRYQRMRWDVGGSACLTDPEGMAGMQAAEALETLLQGYGRKR